MPVSASWLLLPQEPSSRCWLASQRRPASTFGLAGSFPRTGRIVTARQRTSNVTRRRTGVMLPPPRRSGTGGRLRTRVSRAETLRSRLSPVSWLAEVSPRPEGVGEERREHDELGDDDAD